MDFAFLLLSTFFGEFVRRCGPSLLILHLGTELSGFLKCIVCFCIVEVEFV